MNDFPAPLDAAIVWADPARAQAFAAWLASTAARHGLEPASVRPASADASFRRYFRINNATGGSCIIMDAPPDKEDCQPFVKVARLMADAGLPAPRVLAWDEAAGFMLLSDLGAQTMMEVIAPPPAVDAVDRLMSLLTMMAPLFASPMCNSLAVMRSSSASVRPSVPTASAPPRSIC